MSTPRAVELPVIAAAFGELAEEPAVRGVALHAVVATVHDYEVAVGAEGDASGLLELAVAGAEGSPLADEFAVLGEDDDLADGLVGDVEVFLFVNGEAAGPEEFTIAGARAADVQEELLGGDGALGDSGAGAELVAPVGDVHDVVGAPSYAHGVPEGSGGHADPSEVVEVGEGAAHSYLSLRHFLLLCCFLSVGLSGIRDNHIRKQERIQQWVGN